MKKVLKIFIILAVVLSALAALILVISADKETYTVRYIVNGEVRSSQEYDAGAKHLVRENRISPSQTGKQFFGWYTGAGKLYSGLNLGMEITVNSDIDFYEAYGTAVQTKEDFIRCVQQKGPGNYVRLADNITLTEPITLPTEGLSIIDLNNYSLTFNTEGEAFIGKNSSIHIIDTSAKKLGAIKHNAENTQAAMFNYTPTDIKKDASIILFAPTSITTNTGFFKINGDISKTGATFHFNAYGTLSAKSLVYSMGMKDATFNVGDQTVITLDGARAFEDIGTNDGTVLTFNLSDGKYTISEKTVLTNEQDRYKLYVSGGRFNRDIAGLFDGGRYTFKLNTSTNLYEFYSCNHDGIVTGITATCTSAGTISYKCQCCNEEYSESVAALGHANYKTVGKETVTETYPAQAGYYLTTCQRCGHEDKEYFYPQPKDVLIKVWTRNNDGTEKEHIVPATMIYGEDVSSVVKTYTTALFEYEYAVDQKNVIAVEVPLGVTELYGYTGTDNAKNGVFAGNDYLERVVLPQSIEKLGKWTFAEMTNLKEIVNLEYVSKSIEQGALYQLPEAPLIVDDIKVNAETIVSGAFENVVMKTITFGKGVSIIQNNAFRINSTLVSQLVEIFIEEISSNPDHEDYKNGTIAHANTTASAFATLGTGNMFDGKAIVFYGHDDVITPAKPTCQEGDYEINTCGRCGKVYVGEYTPAIPHDYSVAVDVPSTCKVQGYTASKCSMCDLEKNKVMSDKNPNNHAYDVTLYLKAGTNAIITDICTQAYDEVKACDCQFINHVANAKYIFNNATKVRHESGKGHTLDYRYPEEELSANCYQAGYRKVKCSVCETIVEEEIPATNRHLYVLDKEGGVPSTCKTIGYILHVCSNAGCTASRKTPVDLNPDAHVWGEWVTTREATTERTGKQERTCLEAGCGKTETKGISVIDAVEAQGTPWWVFVLIGVGAVVVIALIVVLLYFTVFKKNKSRDFQYTFNQTRRQ